MTKVPEPGRVKTRLSPPLTPEEAAALNIKFLQDTARAISKAGEQTRGVGVYTPQGSEATYRGILPDDFYLIAQRGETFGERLSNAMCDLLGAGFKACCLIDSDSPTVTADTFRAAARALAQAEERIVIGPSDDGGYYLIGMRTLHTRLFEGIDWSTEEVLAQTIESARAVGIEPLMLPTFYDIDNGSTLRRLCRDLLENDNPNAPATREFLVQMIEREGRERIWP